MDGLERTSDGKYKCSYCNYANKGMARLIEHIRIHTGEKPHRCQLCPFASAYERHLEAHMRSHTGEKPYKCDLCAFCCSDRSNLSHHRRRRHKLLPMRGVRSPFTNKRSCPSAAAAGYPRFSGSLAHTFLPMSHLDHHANSSVLYGQHRFYDTQKENFYLRSLPAQPPLISANHSLAPMSRGAGPQGHAQQGSCSRDRDPGGGGGGGGPAQASLAAMEYGKEQQAQAMMGKSLSACLLNGKMQNGDAGTGTAGGKASMNSCGGESSGRGLIGGSSGGSGGSGQSRLMGSASSGGGSGSGGGGNSRCTKEGVSGEMRISEQPSDCLERGQAPLHHSLSYAVPPHPLHMGTAAAAVGGTHPHPHHHAHPSHGHPHAGGFHCLQLHPGHPHHPHHPHSHHAHHHHHPPDFFCPPPPAPAPLANPSPHDRGGASNPGAGRDLKVTGSTFAPSSVGHLGEKSTFQHGNTDCQGVVGVGGGVAGPPKEKVMEKNGAGHPNTWHRKQQQQQQQVQQHPYRKAEKAPDWMQPHHTHLQAPPLQPLAPPPTQPPQQQQSSHSQQHQVVRSRSVECINNNGVVDSADLFRASLTQGAKPGHQTVPHSVNTSPYRDCSHPGPPPPNSSPLGSKGLAQHGAGGVAVGGAGGGGGTSCSLQRDGQKVARIRHQQHVQQLGSDAAAASPVDLNHQGSRRAGGPE
ncbi:hypothetical protein CRUP_007342 [Coryphaenoides rupestris]|nr:hypothetical protein CRUP_007342 [Coryphaenoides rupestris]